MTEGTGSGEEGDRVSGGGIVKFRGDVGYADRGVDHLQSRANVSPDNSEFHTPNFELLFF